MSHDQPSSSLLGAHSWSLQLHDGDDDDVTGVAVVVVPRVEDDDVTSPASALRLLLLLLRRAPGMSIAEKHKNVESVNSVR